MRCVHPKKLLLTTLYFVSVLSLVYFFNLYELSTEIFTLNEVSSQRRFNGSRDSTTLIASPTIQPLILMWTSIFGRSKAVTWKWIQGEPEIKCFGMAPENDIVVTLNRSLWEQAAVIVFHAHDVNPHDLPPTRRQEQIWTIVEFEAPANFDLSKLQKMGVINWTMNYRRDADVWAPYGTFDKNARIIPEKDIRMEGGLSLDQWIANKNQTKLMLWAASRCKSTSRRENLVEKLRNLSLPIDIIGKCGESKNKTCYGTKDCNEKMFWTQLARQYKFYFAAENCLCEDYATEKLWRSLRLGMVPVVYGGANYSQLTPPHSVINVKDFSTPNELADFLTELAQDNERYKSYFLWRSRYHIRHHDGNFETGFCLLREKVFDFRKDPWTPAKSKVYHNVSHHWKFIPARNGLPERVACVAPMNYSRITMKLNS